MKYWTATQTLFLAALVSGCVRMQVAKVAQADSSNDVKGIRYSLPKPFLKVTLQSDGSPTDEPVYLPDTDSTYAIDASAWFGAYVSNVDVENGFLTQVVWKPDVTKVAGEVVAQAADTAQTILTNQAAQQQKISDAEKALADAEVALKYAKAKKQRVDADTSATAADKEAAAKELDQAQVARDAAYNVLRRLQGKSQVPLNAPSIAPPSPGMPTVQMPVLYEVVEKNGFVELKKINNPTIP